MLNGNGELPAFPMRVACEGMMAAVNAASGAHALGRRDPRQRSLTAAAPRSGGDAGRALLEGLAAVVGVWANYSGARAGSWARYEAAGPLIRSARRLTGVQQSLGGRERGDTARWRLLGVPGAAGRAARRDALTVAC